MIQNYPNYENGIKNLMRNAKPDLESLQKINNFRNQIKCRNKKLATI